MSTEKQNVKPRLWILFPEIIGTSIVALFLSLPPVHMLLSGQVFAGIVGLVLWLAALLCAIRFMWRRQYALVWLPMLVMIGLLFFVRKLTN